MRIESVHVAEKIYNMLGPGQQRQVALDDDVVETFVKGSRQPGNEGRTRFPKLVSRLLFLGEAE